MDVKRLIQIETETRPATQEMFKAVNAVIEKRNLNLLETMCVIAHLSANAIHRVQMECDDAALKDEIEGLFHEVLDYYLAAYDQNDINRETKRMMS